MTLGEFIKEYRDAHHMSMDAFSERSGISKAYISLLEKNKHPKTGKPIAPSLQCIKQAAIGMNMDFNELFSTLDGNIVLNEKVSSDSTYTTSSNDQIIKKRLRESPNLKKYVPDVSFEQYQNMLIMSSSSFHSEDSFQRFKKYVLIASTLNDTQLDIIYKMIDQMAPDEQIKAPLLDEIEKEEELNQKYLDDREKEEAR